LTLVAAVFVAALAVPPQQAEPRSLSRGPQTDETVPVTRGARLIVENYAGEVMVRTWDRDSVRVQARHASRARINVRPVATGLRISSSAERGPVGSVDYEITAPTWMPLKIDGHFIFVTVEGAQAEVAVDTHRGDIVIRGGNGVTARSTEGDITVENARGKVNASSVNEGITIAGVTGEVLAETVNGGISMSRMEAAAVEAGTINGNITYEGTPARDGRYRFTSHNGSIVIGVPESANAMFSVRTYNGSFNSNLPVKGDPNATRDRGRRAVYTLGNGSAEFELESFSGGIRLRRPGTMPEPRGREKEKDKQ
jgi:DUF4097 and DUF4098 domain-containing protein YvlB